MIEYNSIFKSIVENGGLVNSYVFYGDTEKAISNAKEFASIINSGNQHVYFIDKPKLMVDDMRDIVESSKTVPPNKYKVFIINNFNNTQLNVEEVLLKTLEDSPKRVVFILIVKNLSTLKDTVRSRCQKFYFKFSDKKLSDYLLLYFSQDFFKGFNFIPTLVKEKDVIELLEDFATYLYLDECEDFEVYHLIRQAICDIKFGLEKQLVIDNLVIQLKKLS